MTLPADPSPERTVDSERLDWFHESYARFVGATTCMRIAKPTTHSVQLRWETFDPHYAVHEETFATSDSGAQGFREAIDLARGVSGRESPA